MHTFARYLFTAMLPYDPELAYRLALRAMRYSYPLLSCCHAFFFSAFLPAYLPLCYAFPHYMPSSSRLLFPASA